MSLFQIEAQNLARCKKTECIEKPRLARATNRLTHTAFEVSRSREPMSNRVERIIEEWMAQTPPENLPGKGKPLDLEEYFRWPEEYRLAYSLLKNAGYVPEEVEQLCKIGRLKEQIDHCLDAGFRKKLESQLEEEQVSLNIRLETRRRRRKA